MHPHTPMNAHSHPHTHTHMCAHTHTNTATHFLDQSHTGTLPGSVTNTLTESHALNEQTIFPIHSHVPYSHINTVSLTAFN